MVKYSKLQTEKVDTKIKRKTLYIRAADLLLPNQINKEFTCLFNLQTYHIEDFFKLFFTKIELHGVQGNNIKNKNNKKVENENLTSKK